MIVHKCRSVLGLYVFGWEEMVALFFIRNNMLTPEIESKVLIESGRFGLDRSLLCILRSS